MFRFTSFHCILYLYFLAEHDTNLSKFNESITFSSAGERGPCHKHVCHYGAICVIKAGYAVCECPSCSEEFEPVCGTDGISYTNFCRLKQEGCQRKADIEVAYHGLCSKCWLVIHVFFMFFFVFFCKFYDKLDFVFYTLVSHMALKLKIYFYC